VTKSEFQELLRKWCFSDADGQDEMLRLKADIEFLAERLFDEYKPTKNTADGPFSVRLAKWIGSAPNETDQANLFKLLKHLFFVGQNDLEAASRTAFSRHILEWLIQRRGINVLSPDARDRMEDALSLVRYTAITDSFNLGDFLRINDIQGHTVRYTWEQEIEDWDEATFRERVMRRGKPDENEKKYLVLLEDFVGSGSQALKAILSAQAIAEGDGTLAYEVLFCPLIICPEGAKRAKQLQDMFPNFRYSPVLELNEDEFISPTATPGEKAEFQDFRECVRRLHPTVVGPNADQDFGPFGYRQTGAVFVKYDNCPDNSLPVLHRKRTNFWEPLFKRASRMPING
jgi:hypothetical protein